MSASTPNTEAVFPSPEQIRAACARIGTLLGSNKYAIVGGAACQVLGSDRITEDIDVVVVRDAVKAARALLKADGGHFIVEPRTQYTHYRSVPPIRIHILTSPITFREEFDKDTATMTVEVEGCSVCVLDPVLLLNAKCRSILGYVSEEKRTADAGDIEFLLRYLARAGTPLTAKSLTNVNPAFLAWFVANNGNQALWEDVGFDPATGRLQSETKALGA